MDSKNTKYDDITLMQYADGELDDSERLSLDKDLINNKELQDRLAVFALTRDDLVNTKMKPPKHIEDLIDEQDRISGDEKIIRFSDTQTADLDSTENVAVKHDNVVVGFFKDYPVQSLAASVMFGLLIGSQGMKSLYTSPYSDVLINRPISEYQSISHKQEEFVSLSEVVILQKHLPSKSKNLNNTVKRLLHALNKDKSIRHIPASKKGSPINIVSEFTNTNKELCKVAEVNNAYLVACINASGIWSINRTK